MMRRIVLLLCFLLSLVSPLLALEYTFIDVSQEFVKEINAFRANPKGYIESLGMEIEIPSYPLPQVKLSPVLSEIARQHLEDMVENLYFSHIDSFGRTPGDRVKDTEYEALFVGESLSYLAFENYISPEEAVDIFMYQLLKSNSDCASSEGAPLLFPYTDVGVAFMGVQLSVEDRMYNVYVICLIWAIPTNTYLKVFVGRVFEDKDMNLCYSPEEGLGNVIVEFDYPRFQLKTLCDGSFVYYADAPGGFVKLSVLKHRIAYLGFFPVAININVQN